MSNCAGVAITRCAQVSQLNQQTAFAKHQSWPMVKPVLLAALICAAPVCASSAQDTKVSVDVMGIGGMSCAHWQSTQAHRLEGTIWIYGFWTGLNYVASASEQTETKVDTKSRKHALSARRRYWPAPCGPLILTSIRGRCARGPKGEKRLADLIGAAIIGRRHRHPEDRRIS
jgi:hypothetical protein